MQARRRRSGLSGVGLVAGVAVACGPVGPGAPQGESGVESSGSGSDGELPTTGGGGSGTTAGSTGILGSEGGTGSGTSEGSSGGGSSSGGSDGTFIVESDGGIIEECDPWSQNCARGEKCVAYAQGGGSSWNSTKCVPVMEDPAGVGEECFAVESGVSGIDNCEFGAMCWDVDEENKGRCVALCTGTPEAPVCDPGFVCPIYSDGVLNLCFPTCDPLEQDCVDPDDTCIGNPGGDGFLCVLDASGAEGQVHDPCEFVNSCDPGLICLNPTAAIECSKDSSGCCQPYCDLTLPNMCPGVGQICNPYYEPGEAPPGYEKVGVCAIPMP